MLRLAAIAAMLAAGPAFAQTVIDGSDRAIPPAHLSQILGAVHGNPDMGPSVQISQLRALQTSDHLYYCGQARRGSGQWQPFYFDTFSGGNRIGILATAICGS